MQTTPNITPTKAPVSTRKLDQRTRAARRIRELVGIFGDALGADLTPQQRVMVEEAAALQTFSESIREKYLAGDHGVTPDDITRAARISSLAVKRLDLKAERRTGPGLSEYIAKTYGAKR